ncbi:hypothetical protein [Halobacillus campisalis]|uniref:Uncharacterized protein n=1 Tax=Halobacillus campisalis TaxID=435909 RepID=A0ABW2JYN8_9BACI|nr:hypothetical protein [Halobacillus campisalis]
MKKYIIFFISFPLIYIVLQITSGWVLTVLHTPDFTSYSKAGDTMASPVLFIILSMIPAIYLSYKWKTN